MHEGIGDNGGFATGGFGWVRFTFETRQFTFTFHAQITAFHVRIHVRYTAKSPIFSPIRWCWLPKIVRSYTVSLGDGDAASFSRVLP